MPLMLPTILRNLLGGPATRMYPVQVREPFENARGHIVINDDKCTLCSLCAMRCPSESLEINKEKNELLFYPARCIVCEVCVHACPSNAIDLLNKWHPPFYEKPVRVHQARGKKKGKEDKESPAAKSEK